MANRDLQGRTNAALKALNDTLKGVMTVVLAVQDRMNIIQPRSRLHKIPKPKNYQKKYGRDPNMAAMFRKLVNDENELLQSDASREFINFEDHISDEEANEDAKRTAYGYMCLLLPEGWEKKKSWTDVCKSWKKESERVIQTLSSRPEFRIFAQGGGDWGTRMVVEQKMKSLASSVKKRPIDAKSNERIHKKAKKHVHVTPDPPVNDSGTPQSADIRSEHELPPSSRSNVNPVVAESFAGIGGRKEVKAVRADNAQDMQYAASEQAASYPRTRKCIESRKTNPFSPFPVPEDDVITPTSPKRPIEAARNLLPAKTKKPIAMDKKDHVPDVVHIESNDSVP